MSDFNKDGRGGPRAGQGRPKGSTNKVRAQKFAEDIKKKWATTFDADVNEEDPIETLEYARRLMRQQFKDTGDIQFLHVALDCATRALPYMMPKLTANKTEVSLSKPEEAMTDEELLIAALSLQDKGSDQTSKH